MHKPFSSLLLSCICFTAATYADASPQMKAEDAPQHMRLGARHIEGKGIGYKKGYTTIEGFFARDPAKGCITPFLDLRGHVFNDGRLASNAGLGIRSLLGCRVYGVNAYYDYRKTRRQHYNQVGAGLETLGTRWDFRANGYLPVGDKKSRQFDLGFEEFSGHEAIISRKFEFAFKEANAEIGWHFWKSKNFDLSLAAGPYYISGAFGTHSWGGKARLLGQITDYVTLEISDSYDRVFHNIFQGEIGIRIPFGPRSTVKRTGKSCFNRSSFPVKITQRMMDPVVRQEIIPVKNHTQRSAAINPETGLPYFFIFVDNTSSSLGTFESPYPTLLQAQNASSPNDVIYVFPGNNTTTGMDAGITLKNNQRFLGASISNQFNTPFGLITVPAQASTTPIITNGGGAVVTLANNNEISGFYIQHPGQIGISAPSAVINLTARKNTIQSDDTANGFALNNISGTVLIADSIITNQDVGISILSTGVTGAKYHIINNLINNQSGSDPRINISLTNCLGTYTNISGNNVFSSGNAINLNVVDAIDNLAPKTFSIANNLITTEGENILLSMSNFADAAVTIASNNLFTPDAAIMEFSIGDASHLALNVDSNIANAWDNIMILSPISGSASVACTITNNAFSSDNENILQLLTQDSSELAATIQGNSLTTYKNSHEPINFGAQNSSQIALQILDNKIVSSELGVFGLIEATANGAATIAGNNFLANVSGAIVLEATSTGLASWKILNNTFIGNVPSAATVTSFNGTTCLKLVDNTAIPFAHAYQLNQAGGVFQLEPATGNIGQIEVNIGTVTNVPAGTCSNSM
ncbi:MAG: inverse autotransporter beta domain-containing protein [Chlamydiales bacterium]|nr:inverse autotransporter beta domain-containing protein [Chlamydiales bacterium]